MSDVYTPPPDSSYLFLTPFYAPTDSGNVWAIAVSSRSGALITAALSVVLLVIFMCLWKLACFIALLYPGSPTRSRYVALVTIWNSNDFWFAFWELVKYAIHFRSEKGNLAYGLTFAICALAVFGGSLALGIVGPSLVQIGNVAPVRPSTAYYPVSPAPADSAGQLKNFGLRASSFLRALGSVEAAMVTKRSEVFIDEVRYLPPWNNTEQMYQLNYNYSLTGAELGLQHGAGLVLAVTGSCRTEYDWIAPSTDDTIDLYNLWGNTAFQVPLDNNSIQNAPKASFIQHPNAARQYVDSGNTSFAIVAWSAHRASISTSSNPWYATEDGNQGYSPVPFNASFWVKRRRPALSCWQHDKWSYGTQTVKSVYGLKYLPGMKIKQVLLQVLQTAVNIPMLVTLGNASGDSALRSRTTSPNGVIDASASSIEADLERLLVGSFVATRNVFVDATMFASDGTWKNIFRSANGEPAPGAGDFVVTSPNIQTFSLVGIIVLLVVLLALLLIESVITLLIHINHQGGNKGKNDAWMRGKVLLAAQLFRRIYEPESLPKDWPCDQHFLAQKDIKVDFELKECEEGNSRCNGHIAPGEKVVSQASSSGKPEQTKALGTAESPTEKTAEADASG
ncbi:hypothetical protein F5B18DRAFT_85289 [Nemania serpens]|nr:hypothetical protein F5B18DRAFT_85289 [Nemania serpens]